MTTTSMFRTPAGQARYFAAYETTLALWPVAVESVEVATRFGPTHLNICGPQEAPPLVLLHGAAISATMWYPNIAALSRHYRVYAPDIVGELGKSVSTQPMRQAADYAHWLSDVLDALKVERAHVAGISLGGFVAFKLAQLAPQRVNKLILLSPASLLPFRPQFYFRLAAAIFTPGLSAEKRQALSLGVASPNALPAIKQMLTPNDFKYQMFMPKTETEDDLRRTPAPTLLLIGEQEVIYDPHRALSRARQFIPHLEAELVPNAGHGVSLDQPEVVNKRMLEFLGS